MTIKYIFYHTIIERLIIVKTITRFIYFLQNQHDESFTITTYTKKFIRISNLTFDFKNDL